MKSLQIARGIAGVLSLAGVMGLVGCGAETGAPEGQIGSTSEAVSLSLATSSYKAKFASSYKLDGDKVFVAGGFDDTGAAIAQAKIYNANGDTWTAASVTNMRARGDAQLILIPNTDKLLFAGGRSSDAGTTFLATADIYDISADEWTQVTASMVQGVSNYAAAACGNAANSELLFMGGLKTGPAAADNLQVFSFDSSGNGKGAGSTWATLQTSAPANLALAVPRAYHQVSAFDTTHLFVMGGEDASANPTDSTELVTVSTSCDAASKASMAVIPEARSRFVSAPVTGHADIKLVLTGGTSSGANVRTATYLYDKTNDSWSTLTNALPTGRVLPTITVTGTNTFAIVAGSLNTALTSASNRVDVLTLPGTVTTTGGTWSTPLGTLNDARIGQWSEYLNSSVFGGNTVIVGHGVKEVLSPRSTTFVQTPE